MKSRRSKIALWVLAVIIFFSITAEFWANNKPILMSYSGQIFAPVFRSFHPSEFQQMGFVTNYRNLKTDWAIWPAIRWSPEETNPNVATFPSAPTKENWLGTDDRGRDVLTRLIYGFRYSLVFALLVWFFTFLFGTIIGAIMGYKGGRFDLVGQRIVEVFDSLPSTLVLLTMVAMLGASLTLLICVRVTLGWMRISMFMRAEFLRLRKREFIEASRAQGLPTSSILVRHILPNALTPLLSFSPLEIAANIYLLALLDYLGLGLPAPTPSWGELLQQANSSFTIAWWLALYPSLAMVLVLSSLTFLAEGLRRQ